MSKQVAIAQSMIEQWTVTLATTSLPGVMQIAKEQILFWRDFIRQEHAIEERSLNERPNSRCAHCGNDLVPSHRFCDQCGADFGAPIPA